jgi:predicted nucleic-acid-binding protein
MGAKVITIDTNVIVRFLTRDDEAQYQKAYQIFAASNPIFIPKTVILETEWVLRFSYKLSSERIVFALSNLLGLENIISENKKLIIIALQWHEQGMDFADALHLSFSLHTQAFLSFDKKMIKKSADLNIDIQVTEP